MENTTMNELIVKLVNINNQLNTENEISNVKLVLAGIEDKRDPIIDKIIFDKVSNEKKYIYDFYQDQIKNMNQYYKMYESNIYFADIVEKIIRILLKNFKLFPYIKEPKGYLISYLFQKGIQGFPNRIWAMFHKYFNKFDETKSHKSLEQIRKNATKLDKSEQDYFESNESSFDMEYHAFMVDKCIRQSEKMHTMDLLNNLDKDEKAWYLEDKIDVDTESKPTTLNNTITIYNVNYEQLRMKNKYNLLTTEEYNKEIDELKQKKLRKWQKYKNETGFLPHDISEYHEGYRYIPAQNRVKNPDHIEVYCEPKEFDFRYLYFDKKVDTYLRNIIVKKLSNRQQLLIGYLYYEMLQVDEIISSMNFVNKTALDKEKHRALKKIKLQILKDYDFILKEFGETFLAYWAKQIKRKIDEHAKKDKKMLSI